MLSPGRPGSAAQPADKGAEPGAHRESGV